MTFGDVLDLPAKVKVSLTSHSLLDSTGNLVKHPALLEAEDIAMVAGDVESMLKADGLPIPPNVDKAVKVILQILPLVVSVVGG